jgi:hypothetical protein
MYKRVTWGKEDRGLGLLDWPNWCFTKSVPWIRGRSHGLNVAVNLDTRKRLGELFKLNDPANSLSFVIGVLTTSGFSEE